MNGPSIKSEDAWRTPSESTFLTSCKNTLKDIGYLSKTENPDSLRKIVNRLPFCFRRRWRDVADNITEKDEREITMEDVANDCPKKSFCKVHNCKKVLSTYLHENLS